MKTEVIQRDGKWIVEATWREPMEYFFEIAEFAGRFESKIDAVRVAARVQEAARKEFPRSQSYALDVAKWNYRSSACEGIMARRNPTFVIPVSEYAKQVAAA